ncbi:MAG: amidohydrolase family protein [Luteitalea sp.]|nr:amidohydrolase family protein [Luteitalea sp.]
MAARLTAYLVSVIVAGTLIAGLLVGAQNDGEGPVDLIIYNGKVYTGAGQPMAEAVAVRGNRILRVGTDWEIRRLRRRETRFVDAHGGTVLPGFNEAHARVVEAGLSRDEDTRTLVEPVEPQHTRGERLQAIRSVLARAHRLGITSIQDISAGAEDLELYEQLRAADELGVRVYALLAVRTDLTEEDAARLDAVRKQYLDDPLLKTGGVRVTVGDVLDQRGPQAGSRPGVESGPQKLLRQADTSAPLRPTQAELNHVVALMDERGWQVMVQAPTADVADMGLEAFLHALEVNRGGERHIRRHRIELDVPLDNVDWLRFQSLGILADLASPVARSFASLEGGDEILLGSRWLGDPGDPLSAIFTAAGAGPDGQRLAAAIDAYTRAPAYASFEDSRKGVIAPEMLADLVVLSTDIFSLPPDRLADSVVQTTIFDGRVVYSRAEDDTQTE